MSTWIMSTRIAFSAILCFLCPVAVAGQQNPSLSASTTALEFPMFLESSVVAGKTAVGTKIQAKLSVATLVDGTVVPRNAIFNGEVIASEAKSATEPSRLAIRLDSAQWKGGSAVVKTYFTAWYYPAVMESGQNLQYGPTQPANRTWNGEGQYPDPNSKIYKPFPGGSSDQNGNAPDTPASVASNRRVLMKNVESELSSDGAITLVSRKSNIKLDKLTLYVVATGDLQAPPSTKSAATKSAATQ
jgi:hypothetical protein